MPPFLAQRLGLPGWQFQSGSAGQSTKFGEMTAPQMGGTNSGTPLRGGILDLGQKDSSPL